MPVTMAKRGIDSVALCLHFCYALNSCNLLQLMGRNRMANKKKRTTMSVREMGDLLGLKNDQTSICSSLTATITIKGIARESK